MKNTLIVIGIAIAMIACKGKTEKASVESTTEVVAEVSDNKNSQEEWKMLFDGTSFAGWKGYLADTVGDAWKVEDGAMVFYPPESRKKNENYDINTVDAYTNFVLSLEWKISEGGNSGIFWGIQEDTKFEKPYHTGPEIQVLDNEKHPDAKNGTTHQAGALYDLVAPSKDVTKPIGEWNIIEITIDHKNNKGKVVLNGEEIVKFPVNGDAWDEMIADSKFKQWGEFGKFATGKIGLQDHGDVVAYRNIKIREL
jgi:3-keto-disaccharide hydrolase